MTHIIDTEELDYMANRIAKGHMPGNARYIFSKDNWVEMKKAIHSLILQQVTKELTTIINIEDATVDAWASPAHQYILERREELQALQTKEENK